MELAMAKRRYEHEPQKTSNRWKLTRVVKGKPQTMRERGTELLHNPRYSMTDVAMVLAEEFNVSMTRNMVIGLNSRLGLQGKYIRGIGGGERKSLKASTKPVRTKGATTKVNPSHTPRGLKFEKGGAVVLSPSKAQPDLELPTPPTDVAKNPKPFLQMPFEGHCKWPVSGSGANMMCCNDPTGKGHSYCSHHRSAKLRPPAAPSESTRVYKAPSKFYR